MSDKGNITDGLKPGARDVCFQVFKEQDILFTFIILLALSLYLQNENSILSQVSTQLIASEARGTLTHYTSEYTTVKT